MNASESVEQATGDEDGGGRGIEVNQ
jgi:hypothetical protein